MEKKVELTPGVKPARDLQEKVTLKDKKIQELNKKLEDIQLLGFNFLIVAGVALFYINKFDMWGFNQKASLR